MSPYAFIDIIREVLGYGPLPHETGIYKRCPCGRSHRCFGELCRKCATRARHAAAGGVTA